MKQIENKKQYIIFLAIAIVIIFIYKNMDSRFFQMIYDAFLPVIIGGVLAYFLQPIVYLLEMRIDAIKDGKFSKVSHTIASIVVFIVFVLLIVALLIVCVPALIDYVVNITENIFLVRMFSVRRSLTVVLLLLII